MKIKQHFLITLALCPGLLMAQNMSFAKHGIVTSYKEREFQVTAKMNQGSNQGVKPASQYTVHLLKKVGQSGSKRLRKSNFYFAGYCQIMASNPEESDVLIEFNNKNDISKLLMDNYLIPYHPIKRHNLIASLSYGNAPFHDNYTFTSHNIITLTGGYRLYINDHFFSGFNLGFSYFDTFQPYAEIPLGWVINPRTYKNTKTSLVFNLRIKTAPHNSTVQPWYVMFMNGNTTDLFSDRDFLYPSVALEFFSRGFILHLPEISMETLSWYNGEKESSLVIGLRLGYGLGFGRNMGTAFR